MRRPTMSLALVLASALFDGSFCVAQIASTGVQTAPVAASAPTAVPALVPYSGVAIGDDGEPVGNGRGGQTSITFVVYKEETGGEPLFTETQSVPVDLTGHYKVQLGATLPNGLPQDLFSTGEARWLEVQVAGQAPQPRVLIASVPYALKAGDATTLGGLPVSAFALAGSTQAVANSAANGAHPDVVSNVTTTGGTAGYIPEFNGTATIIDSPVFILGSDVGIGTLTPTAPLTVSGNTVLNGALTVNGDSTFNGPFVLPPPATATASKAYNSQFIKIEGSAWNSSTKSAVNPRFEWVGEIGGNNTATPTITLNLISSTTSASPTETGFHFNANGTMNFAPGQTFPATSAAGIAVNGTSTSGTGVEGTSSSGDGVEGVSTSGSAIHGVANGPSGILPGSDTGVWGDSFDGPGVIGTSGYGNGVYGYTDAPGMAGVVGVSYATTGVVGSSSNGNGVQSVSGVKGTLGGTSKEGATNGGNSGIWADTGNSGATAFVATADEGYAGLFYNNSSAYRTMYVQNDAASSSTALTFVANGGHFGGSCRMDVSGNLSCTGAVTNVVKVDNGARQLETYSVQSPENWFEDFGSAHLSGGVARIDLDPAFAQTVNAGVEYHVFLTPNEDCKGLYASRKTATSFEVHELGGGTSGIAFDYRIVAKRAGYESVRLKDVTEQMKQAAEQEAKLRHPAAEGPTPRLSTARPGGPAAAIRTVGTSEQK